MLKTVLIGYGYWGPNIAKSIDISSHYELTAICDIDEERLVEARNIYGDRVKYFTDWHDILSLPDIQVAAVALLHPLAHKVAKEVLARKLHLFIEKPFAVTINDALELRDLAQKHKVLIHVDYQLVYNPFIRRIKKIIDNGELGEIVYFEASRTNLGPHIKKDMNAMWDLAVHDIAVLDYLCGGIIPVHVRYMGQSKYGHQEIITYLSVKYDNFMAMIKSSWFSPLKERKIILSGTKKMIVFDDLRESEKLMIYDRGIDLTDITFRKYGILETKIRAGDTHIPNIDFENALLNGLNHFAECLRNNVQSLTSPGLAIRVLSILDQAENRGFIGNVANF